MNDADIDAVGQQPARALVTQVVPMQIDLLELLSIDSAIEANVSLVGPRRSLAAFVANDAGNVFRPDNFA